MTETPRTATGRKLLDTPDVLLMMDSEEIIGINEGELELHVLAIEAEAAQDAARQRDEAVRVAIRRVRERLDYAIGVRSITEDERDRSLDILYDDTFLNIQNALLRATEGKQP